MCKALRCLVVSALLATASSQAIAQSADWVVSEARGPVTVVTAQGRAAAARGTPVNPGDTVITGPGARAVLVHNKDFVTVAANSRIRIPAEARGTGVTRFFQAIGNAVFNVEKRGTPHFSVDTPYLAAVVKGTVFSVTVDADRTSLQVTEGAVEVATTDGGARDLVRPGSIAMIVARDRYRLTVTGDEPRVIDSPARPAAAEAEPSTSVQSSGEAATPRAQDSASAPGQTVVVRIEDVIASRPVDLAAATNGLVTGMSPAIATAASRLTRASLSQPVAASPAAGIDKPAPAEQPAIAKPADPPAPAAPADKPDAAKPADQPAPAKPADKPDAGKPTDHPTPADKPADKPDTGKPADKPDTVKPSDLPDAGKPIDEPDTVKPEDKPDTGHPNDTPKPPK